MLKDKEIFMKRMVGAGFALALVSTLLMSNGCDEVEELQNCQTVCEAKQECLSSNYDVDACVDDCESRSDDDEDFRRSVDVCQACIDERACAEQPVCFDDCPILP